MILRNMEPNPERKQKDISNIRVFFEIITLIFFWPISSIYLTKIESTKQHALLKQLAASWTYILLFLLIIEFAVFEPTAISKAMDTHTFSFVGFLSGYIQVTLFCIIPILPSLFILWKDSSEERLQSATLGYWVFIVSIIGLSVIVAKYFATDTSTRFVPSLIFMGAATMAIISILEDLYKKVFDKDVSRIFRVLILFPTSYFIAWATIGQIAFVFGIFD